MLAVGNWRGAMTSAYGFSLRVELHIVNSSPLSFSGDLTVHDDVAGLAYASQISGTLNNGSVTISGSEGAPPIPTTLFGYWSPTPNNPEGKDEVLYGVQPKENLGVTNSTGGGVWIVWHGA